MPLPDLIAQVPRNGEGDLRVDQHGFQWPLGPSERTRAVLTGAVSLSVHTDAQTDTLN